MSRSLPLVIAAGLMLAAGAFAGHAQSISDSQRGEIAKIIREYLIANPEVLQDAINELEKRKAVAGSANNGQRNYDYAPPKVQAQGAPAMTAGCPCMQMMNGGLDGMGQRGMPDQRGMNMPGMQGMMQQPMPQGTMPPSIGAMGGMSGGGATGAEVGSTSGCCAFPQQRAAVGSQPGDQTLLDGAEELFRTNPLLMPAQGPPTASTIALASQKAEDVEKWSGQEPAPFTLQNLSSIEVTLSAYRGKPVILHFFATWCGPCREELASLRRFVSRTKSDDLSVLVVSVGEPEDRVRRFFDTMPVNFTVLLDRDMSVARAWRVGMLPSTYVLSSELKPKLFLRGRQQWGQLDAAQILKKLDEANREPIQPGGGRLIVPPEKK